MTDALESLEGDDTLEVFGLSVAELRGAASIDRTLTLQEGP